MEGTRKSKREVRKSAAAQTLEKLKLVVSIKWS
jgi:hypothetical protein